VPLEDGPRRHQLVNRALTRGNGIERTAD